jgi:hypothetical protein
MAFGLQPQSHVFYHSIDTASAFRIEEQDGDTLILNRNVSEYYGDGGLNYAFIGGGGQIKGFSFGVNFGYMFGNIRNTSRLVNIDSTHIRGSDFSKYTRLGGLHWKAGIQYREMIRKGLQLRLGATADISQSLNGDRESFSSSFYYSGNVEYPDTAYRSSGERGKVILPATYSLGAQLSGDNWSVATEAALTDWSMYRNYEVGDSLRDKTMRVNVGGEYTPDPLSVYNYLSRITYRIGFYYGTDYVQLRNTDMSYYGLTFGATLPFKRSNFDPYSVAAIHTAIEIGRRGTEANGLAQANYLKLHLGVSLSNNWFVKSRYD